MARLRTFLGAVTACGMGMLFPDFACAEVRFGALFLPSNVERQGTVSEVSAAKVTAADLNGDNYLDLIYAHSGYLEVYYSQHNRGFSKPLPVALADDSSVSLVEVGDLDFDGYAELMVRTSGASSQIQIFYNQPGKTVSAWPMRRFSICSPPNDSFDSTLVLPLVSSKGDDFTYLCAGSTSVRIKESTGSGVFSGAKTIKTDRKHHALTAAKLTNSSTYSLLSITSTNGSMVEKGELLVMSPSGDRSGWNTNLFPLERVAGFARVASFVASRQHLVTLSRYPSGALGPGTVSAASLTMYELGQDGKPTLRKDVRLGGDAHGLTTADFDGDSLAEILLQVFPLSETAGAESSIQLIFYPMDETPRTVSLPLPQGRGDLLSLATADLDRDGKLDIIAAHPKRGITVFYHEK